MPVAERSRPQPNNSTPRKLPLLGIFAIWTVWGFWSAQQNALAVMVGGQSSATRTNPLSLALATAWFWALMTPLLMMVARRIRDRIPSTARQVAAHVGVFAVVHVLDATTYSVATQIITGVSRPIAPLLFSLVTFNMLAYAAISAIILALDSQDALRARQVRESQLETQLALAQFHALRAQLHPHFLFNALNAVSSLIHTDPARADRMLARVSELLRIAIHTAVEPEVRLVDEMEFAKRYLEVESMRYGDRLDVRINMAGETFDALVPNMLLQPLVENAVRHGVAPHAANGKVEVRAVRDGDQLSITVRDTGAGFDADNVLGVGLSTTQARLEKLYGTSQQLTFANVPGGFEARVLLPFRWREATA